MGKVYRNPNAIDDIKRERELARKALVLGIPTAIPFDVVRVGDRFASVFELLNARSFSSIIKEEPEKTMRWVSSADFCVRYTIPRSSRRICPT